MYEYGSLDVRVSFFLTYLLTVFCGGAGFFRLSGFRFWEAAYLIWFFHASLEKEKKTIRISKRLLVLVLTEEGGVGCNRPQPLHMIWVTVVFFSFFSFSLSFWVGVHMCSMYVLRLCDSSHNFPLYLFFPCCFLSGSGLSSCGARNLYCWLAGLPVYSFCSHVGLLAPVGVG